VASPRGERGGERRRTHGGRRGAHHEAGSLEEDGTAGRRLPGDHHLPVRESFLRSGEKIGERERRETVRGSPHL